MKRNTKVFIIYSLILSILGATILISAFFTTLIESNSKEGKFWLFIFMTGIVLYVLLFLLGYFLNKKFPLKEIVKKAEKEKIPLKKKDYFILFLLIGGIIIFCLTITVLVYLTIFLSFEIIKPILPIFKILIYVGGGMYLFGLILSLNLFSRKDKKNIN